MYIKGFAIGADLYGKMVKKEIRREEENLPSNLEEFEVKGIEELKLVSLAAYEGKKRIDEFEWVGDIDSCLADELISL